jgi:hypothetical protein
MRNLPDEFWNFIGLGVCLALIMFGFGGCVHLISA